MTAPRIVTSLCVGLALTLGLTMGLTMGLALLPAPAAAQNLKAVGPVNPENGYPFYYEDQLSLRLALCTDYEYGIDPIEGVPANLLPCVIDPAELPTPTGELSFPDNWSVENFWFMATADFDEALPGVPNLDKALVEFAVEATFGADAVVPGDQVSFARMRIRLEPLNPNTEYLIQHPFDANPVPITSDANGEINTTVDIGISTPDFSGALDGRVGPNFLIWDPVVAPFAPDGYIGDPTISHQVINGVDGFNKVSLIGPNVGGPASGVNLVETDMFFIMGKIATAYGVSPQRLSYARKASGSTVVEIFADSSAAQDIQVELPTAEILDLIEVQPDPLVDASTYYRRFTLAAPPATAQVTNITDIPPVAVEDRPDLPVTDKVCVRSAKFIIDTADGAGSLMVKAESSDLFEPRVLTVLANDGVTELGAIAWPTQNNLAVTMDQPPAHVTVRSDAGGQDTVVVEVFGPAQPVVAGP